MSTNNTSMVGIMFEEIKLLLKQLLEQKQNAQPAINLQEIERKMATFNEKKDDVLLEKLSKLEESIVTPKPQKHQHRVTIDIRSSWAFISLASMFAMILISVAVHFRQIEKISHLEDNDLKYRYIKAFNKTDSVSIYKLEDIFLYNRDEKMIRKIREGVELYERQLLERVRWLEEERLRKETKLKNSTK